MTFPHCSMNLFRPDGVTFHYVRILNSNPTRAFLVTLLRSEGGGGNRAKIVFHWDIEREKTETETETGDIMKIIYMGLESHSASKRIIPCTSL